MDVIELIEKVGIENTRCQFLPQDMLNVNNGKRQGKITFATDPNMAQGLMDNVLFPKHGMIACIVWIPAQKIPVKEDINHSASHGDANPKEFSP
jgi:hypothetical protein